MPGPGRPSLYTLRPTTDAPSTMARHLQDLSKPSRARSMTHHNSGRKTHPNRFPLTLHPTGQYCKKISGKPYYFGSDKRDALERYLEQTSFLYWGRDCGRAVHQDVMIVKTLCNLYLAHRCKAVQGELMSASRCKDPVHSLRLLTRFSRQTCVVGQVPASDLQNHGRKVLRSTKSGHGLSRGFSARSSLERIPLRCYSHLAVLKQNLLLLCHSRVSPCVSTARDGSSWERAWPAG